MRNVTRPATPPSLANNAARWTRELLDGLGRGANADKKRLKSLYGKYAQSDVKSALKRMYNKLCCYCESRIENVTVSNIEHRKPKSKDKFPECTFDGLTYTWYALIVTDSNRISGTRLILS